VPVSPLLKRMEQVDLIKRERSEVDQREVFIHLTEKRSMTFPNRRLSSCTSSLLKEEAFATF
jgi:DNA-binding MarR family transcriptional regulator